MLHHSAISGDRPQLNIINAYHRSRGFPKGSKGYYIGYHILIEKSGKLIWTRSINEKGVHSGNWNHAIGICLSGHFKYEQPTKAQISTLRSIIAELDIPHKNIMLHREVRNTSCPVIDLREMSRIRRYSPAAIIRRLKRIQKRLLRRFKGKVLVRVLARIAKRLRAF